MSALFMNYDLVWFQIHEMLRIEGDGEEQVQEELQVKQLRCLLCLLLTAQRLSGLQPLVPQRNEVVIALSIEVPEKQQVVSVVVKSFQ